MDDTVTVYRCNGCGFNHNEPKYCHHCGTPECPSCKRAGYITNVTEMKRLVSTSIPNLRDVPRNTPQKRKTKQSSGKKMDVLLRKMEQSAAKRNGR